MRDHIESNSGEKRLGLTPVATGSLALVRAYLESGATEDAIACCRRALSDGSVDRAEAQLLLAEALRVSGRLDEATHILRPIPEDLVA